MKKIYLAGPDVFREDAVNYFTKMKSICNDHGFRALSPYDSEIEATYEITKYETSRRIYQANIKLIEKADYILANTNPFRGPSLDAGTAFELGYAKALKKIIVCYSSDITTYKQRIQIDPAMTVLVSDRYPVIEDFGLTDNLMIVHSSDDIFDSFELALNYLSLLTPIRED